MKTISCKARQSIKKILGTAQFGVKLTPEKHEVQVTIYATKSCRNGSWVDSFYITSFDMNWTFYDYLEKNDSAATVEFNSVVVKKIYEYKEELLQKLKETRQQMAECAEAEAKANALAENYHALVEGYKWFYTHDLGVFVNEDYTEENLVGYVRNDSSTPYARDSFILLQSFSTDMVRYDHKLNCYLSTKNEGLTEPIEAVNWYARGFNDAYNHSFCDGQYLPDDYSYPQYEFPNDEARKAYQLGEEYGGHQGYMDT